MINWQLPIETVNGEAAKLVYTSDRKARYKYLITWGHNDENCAWVDLDGTVTAQSNFVGIRNVPEPPVKLNKFLVLDAFGNPSGVFCTQAGAREEIKRFGGSYVLNLATVCKDAPHAFEGVK